MWTTTAKCERPIIPDRRSQYSLCFCRSILPDSDGSDDDSIKEKGDEGSNGGPPPTQPRSIALPYFLAEESSATSANIGARPTRTP